MFKTQVTIEFTTQDAVKAEVIRLDDLYSMILIAQEEENMDVEIISANCQDVSYA